MMDSQETLQTEENVTENVAPEVNETENQTIEVPQTQEEVVARVKELAEADAPAEKQELDALKQAFYKIHKANVAAARAQFIENGGEPEAFLPTPNVLQASWRLAPARKAPRAWLAAFAALPWVAIRRFARSNVFNASSALSNSTARTAAQARAG